MGVTVNKKQSDRNIMYKKSTQKKEQEDDASIRWIRYVSTSASNISTQAIP